MALVHERQVGAQVLAVALGHLHAAGVGRHDHDVAGALPLDVVEQDRHGGEMVDGLVEEALDLTGVQVDAHHAVGARDGEHVGDQLGGDRHPILGLAVLAGVAVERAHRGDALGRRPLGRVDHDQLLHDRVVHGPAVGLDDEHVGPTNVLAELAVGLAVGEVAHVGFAERYTEPLGDRLGQLGMRATGVEPQRLLRDQLHRALRPSSLGS